MERVVIYQVTYESEDDGHRVVAQMFSAESDARKFLKKIELGGKYKSPAVVSAFVTKENGKYFPDVDWRNQLPVDHEIIKAAALEKLTKEEKEVLGL
jgi:hypothetical protein